MISLSCSITRVAQPTALHIPFHAWTPLGRTLQSGVAASWQGLTVPGGCLLAGPYSPGWLPLGRALQSRVAALSRVQHQSRQKKHVSFWGPIYHKEGLQYSWASISKSLYLYSWTAALTQDLQVLNTRYILEGRLEVLCCYVTCELTSTLDA